MSAAPEIRFDVFGDESTNGEIVAYGAVMVPAEKVDAVIAAVKRVKSSFGAEDAKLHCKELFHDSPRRRSPWAHLARADAFRMVQETSRTAREAGARTWVGYLDARTAPQKMYFEGNNAAQEQEITDLHLVLLAYWTAMGPVSDLIPLGLTRAWMDPNNTRLRMLGQNRQIRLSQGFFPLNHNDLRFEPMQIGAERPTLLDLADIAVHCAARALSTTGSPDKSAYETVLHAVRPGLSVAHFGLHEGPIISVQANTAAIDELRRDLMAPTG